LSNISSALRNGEWKAATILAGSLSEALLLWAINKSTPTRKADIDNAIKNNKIKENDLNNWNLDMYNKVSREIGIIEERTFNQVNLAREFRNYIHPGVEVRKRVKCNVATAHAGRAAVEFLIEDLSEKFKKI
jgi:hypothetical protein